MDVDKLWVTGWANDMERGMFAFSGQNITRGVGLMQEDLHVGGLYIPFH